MNKQTQKISLVFLLFFLALPLCFAWIPTGSDSGSVTVGPGTGGGTVVVNPEESNCTEYWIGDWSNCTANSQTFLCSELAGCGTEILKPTLCGTTQSCGTTDTGSDGTSSGGGGGGGGGGGNGFTTISGTTDCTENWACFDWGVCSGGTQERECNDINNCNTDDLKPSTERSCSVEGAKGDAALGKSSQSSGSSFFGGITGAVIGGLSSPKVYIPLIFGILIVGAAIFIVAKRRKKDQAPEMN